MPFNELINILVILVKIFNLFYCLQSFKLEAAKGLAELCKDPAGLTKVSIKKCSVLLLVIIY